MHGRLLLISALAAFVSSAPLYAQVPETDAVAPAHVAHVDGTVSLEREGRTETSPLNMPLLSGDRLRTGADGRVEVLFADGSTLHLDMRSSLDVQSDDLVRLTEGRLRLNILGPARTVAYRIDSPAGSARIMQPGEYRIALVQGNGETQIEVAVVRGAAEVFTDQGSTPLRAGERGYASAGLAPSYAYAYNSANWDAFDRWSEARRDVRLGVSSQYLPPEMQPYAPVLDQDGDWRYTQSYGYAWYPRVAADWRPYYYGRWASYPRYGWTWIGADRFAWPTHHYGRWGFSAGVWFWIPSTRWAPAYVSWGYAPGYVSWCPLGFDNRPVIAIDFYRAGPGFYSPWRAWTSVSYSHFGVRGDYVNQRAVQWDRFDRGHRPRFETRPAAPGFSRDIAVPRNATPIRWAGGSTRSGTFRTGEGTAPGRIAPPSRDTTPTRPVRDGAGTRYVNRGDAIVRSQTERPTPRAGIQAQPFDPSRASESPGAQLRNDGAQSGSARDVYAVPRSAPGVQAFPSRADRGAIEPRTLPAVPARRAGSGFDPSRAAGSPRAESRDEPAPVDRSRASGSRPSAVPRSDEPSDQGQSRPRGMSSPENQPPPPSREAAPRAYERPRSGFESQPPQRQPERAAPAERAPSRGEGRQPPAERARGHRRPTRGG
jgi:hypothetical protein